MNMLYGLWKSTYVQPNACFCRSTLVVEEQEGV
jgi:hypothetical protein